MQTTVAQPALQRQTLRLYGEFLCRAPQWGGKLAVACFESAAATGWAAAASLAGAASLSVDSDAARLKLHFRDGAFDFLVNTLDEALRALKNEVRKGRPLAIALHGEPACITAEMMARGVIADLLLYGNDAHSTAAQRVLLNEEAGSARLREWLGSKDWSVQEIPMLQPGKPEKKSVAEVLPAVDQVRGRWLRDLSKFQRSVSSLATRVVWASAEERTQSLQ